MVTKGGFEYLGFPLPLEHQDKKQKTIVSKDQEKLL
jgi:hypothetical protein